jgi:hypothetical protein
MAPTSFESRPGPAKQEMADKLFVREKKIKGTIKQLWLSVRLSPNQGL